MKKTDFLGFEKGKKITIEDLELIVENQRAFIFYLFALWAIVIFTLGLIISNIIWW